MAVGMAMAQQMMNQLAASPRRRAPGSGAPAAPARHPGDLGPADAAKLLGVSEADVVASLEAGDLQSEDRHGGASPSAIAGSSVGARS
jgi:hypothetical protein